MIFLTSKIERQAREGESERRQDRENLIKGQTTKEEGEEWRKRGRQRWVNAPHMFCKHFS